MSLDRAGNHFDSALSADGTALLQREEAAVRRVINRYIRDAATADDLFQEVSIKVLKRLGTLREPGAIRGWLFQIARNACLDYLRREDRRPNGVSLDYVQQKSKADWSRNPSDQFCSKERIRAVHTAIEELPASQREALYLRLKEGLDHQAIADRLGISRQAVEVRLCRGRANLRERLGDILGGDL